MSKNNGGHTVYILECADGSYYTGYTNDMKKRLENHQSGKGAKYTRGRTPVHLIYEEHFKSKEEAMSREYAIKHKNREYKEQLIKEGLMDEGTEKL